MQGLQSANESRNLRGELWADHVGSSRGRKHVTLEVGGKAED